MTMIISGSDGVTFPDSTTQNTTDRYGFVNRILNGDMRIDQRNAGAAVTPSASAYTLDRMEAFMTQASKYSVQQNAGSVTPPTGFVNYLGITSTSAYSVLTGDVFALRHMIEGFNIADFGWGTSGAKTVTLSFWVRSSLTGTFGGSLMNSAQDRAYPFTYTISSANTWEQKSITITGETTGTWVTNNGIGVRINFSIGSGSTFSGTAGAWASSNLWSTTGATSVVGTNGATFYITGVQLEVGSVATPFERRPFGTELQLCQRYFELLGVGRFLGRANSTSVIEGQLSFVVTKRATPTISFINGTSTLAEIGIAIRSFTGLSSTGIGTTGLFLQLTGSSGLTSPNMMMFYNSDSIASASSEL